MVPVVVGVVRGGMGVVGSDVAVVGGWLVTVLVGTTLVGGEDVRMDPPDPPVPSRRCFTTTTMAITATTTSAPAIAAMIPKETPLRADIVRVGGP